MKALFESIDNCLYEDGDENRPKTSDSFQSNIPSLSVELQSECAIWKERFPHLR